ncbi:MAG: PAS domain S-box protein [Candidatus Izimaplasma sp.]|nr:PAS domain S-box protein [Candidatus Izimaplasma bacterium]
MTIINSKYLEQYDGVLVTVDMNDIIVEGNQLFFKLLGYEKSELIKTSFLDLIVPEDKPLYNEYTYRPEKGRDITLKIYHKRGAYRFFAVRIHQFDTHQLIFGHPIQRDYEASMYESGPTTEVLALLYQQIQAKDITELFQFDKSVSLLLDLMPIDLWIKDRYDRYIFCNKSFTEHTGNTLEDVYLKDDFAIFSEDIANSFRNSDNEAKESKKRIVYSFESFINNREAFTEVTKIPVYNKDNKYIGIIGYAIDITDEKKAENVLNEERDKTAFLLNQIDGIVFEIDSEGNLTNMKGQLVHYFKSDTKATESVFEINKDSAIFGEKIQLTLQGTQSSLVHQINDMKMKFTFFPFLNQSGKYSILGYGKQVTEDDSNQTNS